MTAIGTAVAKTFINICGSDSAVLAAVENVLIDTVAKIYNVDKTSEALIFIKGNIVNGNVNKIAKTAISAVEKIPTRMTGTDLMVVALSLTGCLSPSASHYFCMDPSHPAYLPLS